MASEMTERPWVLGPVLWYRVLCVCGGIVHVQHAETGWCQQCQRGWRFDLNGGLRPVRVVRPQEVADDPA